MDCPYPDCTNRKLTKAELDCGACSRPFKICGGCHSPARAFSSFCSQCGQALAASTLDWSGYRGGASRLSLNPYKLFGSLRHSRVEPVASCSLQLDERCLALLSCDRHLVAMSTSGQVEIVSPTAATRYRLRVPVPVHGHPCVERGSLFVCSESGVSAYSLGALTLSQPVTSSRWTVELPGRPTDSLLVVGECLFVSVTLSPRRQGVVVVENIFGPRASPARVLVKAPRLGRLAGNGPLGSAFVLAESRQKVVLHQITAEGGKTVAQATPIEDLPDARLDRKPLAVMGNQLMTIFGEQDTFYRLHAGRPTVRLGDGVRQFALNSLQDSVQLVSGGILFPTHPEVELRHMDRVHGAPVVLRNFAAVFGMANGRLRLHDMANPPFHIEVRVDPGHEITALASFGPFLAAGTSNGTVALYQIKLDST